MRPLFLLLTLVVCAFPLSAATITVNSNADTVAADTACTLREALLSANSDTAVGGCAAGSGSDRIVFLMSATTLANATIALTGALPAIIAPVALDGRTQPYIDGRPTPRVILDGQDSVASGIVIEQSGGGSEVRALVLIRFVDAAIVLRSSNNVLEGNAIGMYPNDDAPRPNGSGILILGMPGAPASKNTIGRPADGSATNSIGGNRGDGIIIRATPGGTADANVVSGNRIGIGAAQVVRPNGGNGILIEDATNNIVTNNNVTSSGANGIYLLGARQTSVLSSTFGSTYRGGNTLSGVRIESSALHAANDNRIGTPTGLNGIEANRDSGIRVISGTGNSFVNLMRANRPLPIDLGPAGETPNDACDVDAGANLLQNKPVLGEQTSSGGTVSGSGYLVGAPSATYRIDFYRNRAVSWQTELHLGSMLVTTDATCIATFSYSLAAPPNFWVAATATDAANNTSELMAVPPPQAAARVAKSFAPAQIVRNGSPGVSRMTVRITNPINFLLVRLAFADSLPAHLFVAADPAATNSCGGTLTAAPGQTTITLEDGVLAAGAACEVTVSIVADANGSFTNTLPAGSVTADSTFNTAPASATLQVVPPVQPAPSVAKTFTPSNAAVGQPARLTITLTAMSNVAVTGAAFNDAYPAGLVNAGNPQAQTTCGGTVTAAPNGSSLALSGGTIPASGSCTVSAFVIATTAGNITNEIPAGAVTTANAQPNATAGTGVLAASHAEAIPTLSEWAMLIMVGLFAAFAVLRLRG